MSKWLAAAQAIALKTGGGGSARSVKSQSDTHETGERRLYTLYAPPTLTNSEVAAPSVIPANDADHDEQQALKPADLAELVALVNLVADHHAFTPAQRAEARQIAQADQVAGLECFRSLAKRDGLTIP